MSHCEQTTSKVNFVEWHRHICAYLKLAQSYCVNESQEQAAKSIISIIECQVSDVQIMDIYYFRGFMPEIYRCMYGTWCGYRSICKTNLIEWINSQVKEAPADIDQPEKSVKKQPINDMLIKIELATTLLNTARKHTLSPSVEEEIVAVANKMLLMNLHK